MPKEGLPYIEESVPLYEYDYDRVPSVRGHEVDVITQVVLRGQTSSDRYERRVTAEQIMRVAAAREPENGARILRSLQYVQALYPRFAANDFQDLPANAYSRALIKLLTHTVSSYTDNEYRRERGRHQQMVLDMGPYLLRTLPFDSAVLVGSFHDAKNSLWHPFFSDIDLVLLRDKSELPVSLDVIKEEYESRSNPPHAPWVYINYGAKAGIGGLTRDPHFAMYTRAGFVEQDETEKVYLKGLFRNGCTHIAGNRQTTDNYMGIVRALSYEDK